MNARDLEGKASLDQPLVEAAVYVYIFARLAIISQADCGTTLLSLEVLPEAVTRRRALWLFRGRVRAAPSVQTEPQEIGHLANNRSPPCLI